MESISKIDDLAKLYKSVWEFRDLEERSYEYLASQSTLFKATQGQTLLRYGRIESDVLVVIDGSIRLLGKNPFNGELFTIGRMNQTQAIGIIDIFRQSGTEACIARQDSTIARIPSEVIYNLYKQDAKFATNIDETTNVCEGVDVLASYASRKSKPPENIEKWLVKEASSKNEINTKTRKLLSSKINGYESYIGCEITEELKNEIQAVTNAKLRFFSWYSESIETVTIEKEKDGEIKNELKKTKVWQPGNDLNLEKLGIIQENKKSTFNEFNLIRAKDKCQVYMATLKMISQAYKTPFPIDVLEKIVNSCLKRTDSISFYIMGQMLEIMGLQTQIGEVKYEKLHRLELPVLIETEDYFSVLTYAQNEELQIADPKKGWTKYTFEEAKDIWHESLKIITVKRLTDTPTKTFGWSWFSPVIKRFKLPLVQVLLASLFIQLFQLANPLLIQQIIDKVINQSNLSALQVLGGALVVAALFQGLLTALRTWLLIDTTDRMDIMLGTQVIDKLLRLPLRFFEKRPVGELSQRLGELNNVRGFLTGTAITSVLDILFAIIYIIIMIAYSPILTAAALSTIPLYILIVIFIAPLYRKLLRNQAECQARTQSHIIETLGGIQTVKSQHFELNSRWKWQEKYSNQISEGFKSVVLGSSAGEVGNFLNQLSSLLIIWVGVYLVINSEISLGQMIAFRIIAGYVTGPILRLSGLWQGFQRVGISMERLADIVDQIPESGNDEGDQISLPPIRGNVRFENLKFRFTKDTAYQINNVSLTVNEGEFIGIAGQSGSGKSTLMKFLPRLYKPEEGRIIIDGYDIDKVNLDSIRQQIGIVPQDCLLFEGTIKNNITMNYPDADTETIIQAAKAADAHDFIMELPNGYGTVLGERGAGLSGGQKQRIAIARTILQNPNILILDEATSALDYETESRVCANLQSLLKGKTVFFITHRLNTIKHADKIVLMHNGEIAEQGTHKELIEKSGRYATLYNHQGED